MIAVYILAGLVILFFAILYATYNATYKKKNRGENGIVKKFLKYDRFKASIKENIKKINAVEHEVFSIKSTDGFELTAKYYEYRSNAPVALFFHGYRSYAEFDGSYLFHIFRRLGCNVLLVNQRAHSDSRARSITFGVKESDDCICWVDFIAQKFGRDTKVILCGMSMGATTVMMASNADFKADVRGIIADCGFFSPAEAIRHSIKLRKYPLAPAYFFARLSAILFAGFDPEKHTTADALSKTTVPVLIIHGDEDTLVPYEMGVRNYNAARSEKKLVTVHGAGHAVSGGVDPELYEKEINDFVIKNIR